MITGNKYNKIKSHCDSENTKIVVSNSKNVIDKKSESNVKNGHSLENIFSELENYDKQVKVKTIVKSNSNIKNK